MSDTIQIGRSTYKVVHLEEHEGKLAAYELIGQRATYTLVRNVPRPHMLFAITKDCKTTKHWFSDKDGKLKVLNT